MQGRLNLGRKNDQRINAEVKWYRISDGTLWDYVVKKA